MKPDTHLTNIFRLHESQKNALKKLDITTLEDLLYHFPARYESTARTKHIHELVAGEMVSVYGEVTHTKVSKSFRKKTPLGEITIKDHTGTIRATWFNQAYTAKMIAEGELVRLSGKPSKNKSGVLYFANPEFEHINTLPANAGTSLFNAGEIEHIPLLPTYPESNGITSRWFYHAMQKILKTGVLDELEDPIPKNIRERYHLPALKTALIWIHSPQMDDDALAARKRFAFQEIFFIQLSRQNARKTYKQNPSFVITPAKKDIAHFVRRFPFSLTGAQEHAIQAVLADFSSSKPMIRLLEGDVGSGKTAVAAATAYAVAATQPIGQNFGNLQVAYMAPTEILAKQHFESFIEYFKHLPITIGLITGSGCKKFPSKVDSDGHTDISRAQFLKWVKNGEITIIIGTHALIQKNVTFKNLGYVIIDEQHRFGTLQRSALAAKSECVPHLLSMTATPIPRTLALTIFGDLDLTLLDEMPAGRKAVRTKIIPPAKRAEAYEDIRKELALGRQVYVICPRIDEPDPEKKSALRVKSVKAEAARLKKNIFPEYTIEVVHSKLPPREKETIMEQFADKKIDILVSTSVIEVGVNVPNATVIVIEGAERFGLAQLHQLRGRVLRSTRQAYCYVYTDTKTTSSFKRLKALVTAKNGFELSELDLTLRGAGELSGKKQWGISDLGMEAIKNIRMVEAARTEARALIETGKINNYPLLSAHCADPNTAIHFE